MANLDDLKEELLTADDEFRRLHDEHQECERQLADLNGKAALSPEAEAEAKRIKLHKLTLKDRMHEILRERSEQRVPA